MNYNPGTGLITWPVDLQSSILPVCDGCTWDTAVRMEGQGGGGAGHCANGNLVNLGKNRQLAENYKNSKSLHFIF